MVHAAITLKVSPQEFDFLRALLKEEFNRTSALDKLDNPQREEMSKKQLQENRERGGQCADILTRLGVRLP